MQWFSAHDAVSPYGRCLVFAEGVHTGRPFVFALTDGSGAIFMEDAVADEAAGSIDAGPYVTRDFQRADGQACAFQPIDERDAVPSFDVAIMRQDVAGDADVVSGLPLAHDSDVVIDGLAVLRVVIQHVKLAFA